MDEPKPPSEIIKSYKRALVQAKGKNYADETVVHYDNGWFHVQNVDGTDAKYRRRQMLFFTESLLEEEHDPDAYGRAKERRDTIEREKANRRKTAEAVPFDAVAYNKAVQQRIEAQRQFADTAQPLAGTSLRTPKQSFAGCFLSLLVIAASGALIWWCVTDSQQARHAKEEAMRQPSALLDAKALFREYKDNEVSADLKYKNKYIVVSGVVRDVGKDLTDTIYVAIESDNWPFSVQCFFGKDAAYSVGNIRKGQNVSILGRVDGKFGNVMVKECSLQ